MGQFEVETSWLIYFGNQMWMEDPLDPLEIFL